MSEKKDLKLNLPHTKIPMKAGLNKREPEFLKIWAERSLYKKIRKAKKGKHKFHLHDGPPYANGQIHLGHAVNKVLKDIVVKSKSLSGYDSPFIPGWDCHGLPIEMQVEKKLGRKKRELSQDEFRSLCRDYAKEQINLQKIDFERLGVLGDWENRYASLDQEFEGDSIKAFSRIFHNGHVEKGFKPVHWCLECSSSLAEAEVDYIEKKSNSIDVKFIFNEKSKKSILKKLGLNFKGNLGLIIWTTTPWTIPGNQAVCVNKDIKYQLLDLGEELVFVAHDLVEECISRWKGKKIKETNNFLTGADFEKTSALHPLFQKAVPLLIGDHVTTETGTGFVHTAPAHGVDDYQVCNKNNIEVENPILPNGTYREDIEFFSGMHVRKVEDEIIAKLIEKNSLINCEDYNHSYPHCWRHKTPLIFMATPQWFISMTKSGLLEGATRAIENIEFIPNWGRERMSIMLKERPDWCISRQRDWGIPIPLLFKSGSGDIHPNQDKIFEKASEAVIRGGISSWANLEIDDDEYEKSKDIFDVWFDSGVTHFCVMDNRFGPNTQSDLYLEGSDQHRGWFQSSLLTSIAMKGMSPFKSVLTHGFVVDKEGRKMSKSIGNIVTPQEVISESGADILRFWIASTDFRGEMAFSKDIFDRSIDGFRRIRNTMRFMISNLYDFDNEFDESNLLYLDRILLNKTNNLQDEIRKHYEEYNFHLVISKILNFCVNELGGLYLDVIKDRLYTMKSDSLGRKSAQFTLNKILLTLLKSISPVLSFTSFEFYEEMFPGKGHEIFLVEWDKYSTNVSNDEVEIFKELENLRNRVYQEVERKREIGEIKNALDSSVEITLTSNIFEKIKPFAEEYSKFLICSSCEINLGKKENIEVKKSVLNKCSRCWHKVEELNENDICGRCESNINGNGEDRSLF